jgi:hypothetical protein
MNRDRDRDRDGDRIRHLLFTPLNVFVVSIAVVGVILIARSLGATRKPNTSNEFQKEFEVKREHVIILVRNLDLFERKGFLVNSIRFKEKNGDAMVIILWVGQLEHLLKEILTSIFPSS